MECSRLIINYIYHDNIYFGTFALGKCTTFLAHLPTSYYICITFLRTNKKCHVNNSHHMTRYFGTFTL